ncbi:hypothetical protein ISN45_Aa07g010900 [Arabidopsis thaliana x Arabidopsis arenosa]|uniref:Defensin-like protein n=2 Tax=Arabidopsis TaxID=3701 RepID=A0A8T1YHY3_ARASU|nr:hypothetical protein ISN45_Aa07g010900 [Arabidopsis thaliana x Arabidopsis arenosa]KAG7545652.1 hypothetical protein ISN44_As12g010930 [Arabidopsis suecica]
MERKTLLAFFVSFLIMCASGSVVDQTNANTNKLCEGGAGLCTPACAESCCDFNCIKKYNGGHGSCTSVGNIRLCQCEYSC